MAQTATISSKGQVVIPAELRRKYNLKPRTKVVFGEHKGKLTVESSTFDRIMALRGCLKDVNEDIEALLMEERRKDRLMDEKKFTKSL